MKKIILLLLSLSVYFLLNAQQVHPSKAYLGVHHNNVSNAKAKALGFENTNGAYITKVLENTAAEKNNLRPFDYLTGINDRPFSGSWSFAHAMQELNAGDQASLQMVRNGKEMSMPITFGKQSDAIYRKMPKAEEPFLGVKQDHYNWKENVPGVKVQIVKNSAAEKMQLQDDDIITAINDNKIVDWHDLGTAVDNMKPGEPIQVNFLRNEQEMVAASTIQSYGQTYKSHHKKEQEEEEEEEEIEETETPEILQNLITEVDMENVTQEEADDMKDKVGVDMPIINNLEIEQLDIFPNPSNGAFNLTFDLPNEGATSIRIFNGAGRLIYQNDLQQFSGNFNDRIDLSNTAKGIYFLAVSQDGKTITKKIITQ